MNEAEWLASQNENGLLEFLKGRVSDRKLRLLAVACLRAVNYYEVWTKVPSRQAIDVAERWADGTTTQPEREQARSAARRIADQLARAMETQWPNAAEEPAALFASACVRALDPDASQCASDVIRILQSPEYHIYQGQWDYHGASNQGRAHRAMLREVVGNPFRPVQAYPTWFAWNDGAVRKMAQGIYDERRFEGMPLLADALEDAGCADAAILAHCREPGEHVRGCWVVDLLLGKT